MKKTAWFPVETLPVHKGAYETRTAQEQDLEETNWFNWWNGKKWGLTGSSPDRAKKGNQSLETICCPVQWRGLSEPTP